MSAGTGKSGGIYSRPGTDVPPDDLRRLLTVAQADQARPNLPHLAMAGDTYTILITGEDTAGQFCLIDMHVPPGGGPPPHRHDFEETFVLLGGELNVMFRGKKSVVRAGETVNIPSNAPHQFHNGSQQAVRMLCLCSPAGQENFFLEVGVPVATRTTPAPQVDAATREKAMAKAKELAPTYKTEFLEKA
jgi:quercetin dioxygenase-like cupin family protein